MIQEGDALWVVSKYLNEPAKATMTSRMTLKGTQASGSPTAYCQVISDLLRSYRPNDVVAVALK